MSGTYLCCVVALLSALMVIDADAAAANVAAGNCLVNIRSYANYGQASSMMGWMAVNGVTVYNVSQSTDQYAHRGTNVALIDPVTCEVLVYNFYDTYNSAGQATDLNTFINYIAKGSILAVGSNDEASNSITPALSTLRAANIQTSQLSFLGQYAFLIQAGFPGKTRQLIAKNSGGNSNYITLNARITGTVGSITFVPA